MKNTDQRGFAAVEAFLVLVVLGIIGFTGWFVYHSKQATDKSFASNDSSNTMSKKSNAPEAKMDANKTMKVDTLTDYQVTLTAPTSWTASHPAANETKINGPGGDVYVHVIGRGGLGGICDPTDSQSGTIKSVNNTALDNTKFSLSTYVLQGGYYANDVSSVVVLASDAAGYKVGNSACDTYLDYILSERQLGKPMGQSAPNISNTEVSIESNAITAAKSAGKAPSPEQIQQFVNSADYKAAVEIVKSFTYK